MSQNPPARPATRRHLTRLLAVLVAVAMSFAACGDDDDTAVTGGDQPDATQPDTTDESTTPDATFPVTVTADNGDVVIDELPVAIVSLSPSITEMVYAVGAGDQVIAVDKSSDYPEGTPMTDISGFSPNVEAIGALEPDLVIAGRDRDGLVATLESVGIPVVLLEAADSLDDVYRQIETVGAATGHADEGERVAAELQADMDEMAATVAERDEPLTYYFELTDSYGTATSETFMGSVFSLAGLVNIADGVDPAAGGFPQLTAEYVLDADPDVIFVGHTTEPTVDDFAARPGWSELTAVAEDRVVILDPSLASRWGPRVADLFAAVLDATAEIP